MSLAARSSLALPIMLCAASWSMVAYGARHALLGWQAMRQTRSTSAGPVVRRQLLVWVMAAAVQVVVVVDIANWAAWSPPQPPQLATGTAAMYSDYNRIIGTINFLAYISATIMSLLTLIRFKMIMAKSRFWYWANRLGIVLLPGLCVLLCFLTGIYRFYNDLALLFPGSSILKAIAAQRAITLSISGVFSACFVFFDMSAIVYTFRTVLAARQQLANLGSSSGVGDRLASSNTISQVMISKVVKQTRITVGCCVLSMLGLLLYIYTITPMFGPPSLFAATATFCLTLYFLSSTLMMDSLKELAMRQPAHTSHKSEGTAVGRTAPESVPVPSLGQSQAAAKKTVMSIS